MSRKDLRFLHLLATYALVVLLVHLLVQKVPVAWAYFWYPQKLVGTGGRLSASEWLWGVYPFTYLPAWLRWLSVGLAALTVLWAGFSRAETSIRLPGFPRSRWAQGLIALMSLPLFFAGRVVHTRWGDAYLLVHGIAHPDVQLTYNWQAPLDIFLHARLYQLGERLWGWSDALPAYWWISSLAGGVAVWVLLQLAADVGRNELERWAIFGIMATLGAIQLFFGYPENYTIISLLILLYLWLSWRYLQGKSSLWSASVVLALALGFHPSTLVLQPSLWVLAYIKHKNEDSQIKDLIAPLIVPPLVVVMGTFTLMSAGGRGADAFLGSEAPGGGDHRWLVPLFDITSDWEYYTMFSRSHLIEFINQQLLTAPFTLPLLLVLTLGFWSRLPRDSYSLFLLVAAFCYVMLTWVWNPDYGGQRDWDLFAPAAWPATLLAVYWITRAISGATLTRAALIIVVVQLVHTAAWVYSNTLPWEWP